MPKPLKPQNTPKLWLVVAANILLFLVIIFGVEFLEPGEQRIWPEVLGLLPFGAGLIFVGVINAIIGPFAKARIVFWRWQ